MSVTILSGLANGQVLQRLGSRGADAIIIGAAGEDGPIRVTISKAASPLKGWNKREVGKAKGGKFRAKLASVPVGGPYRLRLEVGKSRAEVASFFVGDVWILAGQSNMEGVGDMTGAAKPHPLIRAFSMRREWRLAEDPLHLVGESPDACHTAVQCSPEAGENLRKSRPKGVGVGIFFAREMLARSGGVPQGLVCTAHGGTSMQQWSPERKNLGGASLYASMLMSAQATGQPVAGLLWYQGESDANPEAAAVYTQRMRELVAASRRDLRQPRLPWLIVQIAQVFLDPVNPQQSAAWDSIREQQRLLPGKIKGLETVSAIDLPLDDQIHIGSAGYPRLGVRLARVADRMIYGNKREAAPPQFGERRLAATPKNTVLEVKIANATGGLRSPGEPRGFTWVSPEGIVQNMIYKTELAGDTVKLYLTRKPDAGLRLYYGFGYTPICNITDARDCALPAAGPLDVANVKPKALTPFITQWNLTPIVTPGKPLDRITLDEVKELPTSPKTFGNDGLVNQHSVWEGKAGLAFFRSVLHLSEPMRLEFLLGYDGPLRVWLSGKPFFIDMAGINPCIADESAKIARLAAGAHEVVVGMDLNHGLAWGFFLRMARLDVSAEQLRTGVYVKPTYSV